MARQSNREAMSRLVLHRQDQEESEHWIQIGTLYVKLSDKEIEERLKESLLL